MFSFVDNDEDILTHHDPSSVNHSLYNIEDTNQGSLTQSCAKKLQIKVNLFLTKIIFDILENIILPKCLTYVLLRLKQEGATVGPKERRCFTRKLNWYTTWLTAEAGRKKQS